MVGFQVVNCKGFKLKRALMLSHMAHADILFFSFILQKCNMFGLVENVYVV